VRGATRTSICSQGVQIDYYWWGCPKADTGTHINATVDALVKVVKANPAYDWTNPYQEIHAKGRFKSVLQLACEGHLKPLDHVKSIDGAYPAELFEMRWNDIPVYVLADGQQREGKVLVRLFYGEAQHLSFMAVGLHVWEKPQTENQRRIHDAQEAAIQIAVERYWEGVGTGWGFR